MDKFLSSHFDSESPEYYPEDFQGAAPGDGIIYISSDDDMECASSASVDNLGSLSDDDEVALLAQCVEISTFIHLFRNFTIFTNYFMTLSRFYLISRSFYISPYMDL